VDDEPLARKLIATHMEKIEGFELAGECENAFVAGNLIRSKTIDLVFLDIQMPEVTGIQLVNSLHNPPAIILTTAFREFAPEAFDLNVVDYLLKPISFERLQRAVNKFLERMTNRGKTAATEFQNESSFLYLKADRKINKIPTHNILYIESLNDYVRVITKEKTYTTRENISSLEEKLSSPPFVRIHRSYIINANCVNAISSEVVWVNGKELPFGRMFKKTALSLLSIKLP
jgi:DNA-binding LytR/AlgR family response regulator